MKVRYKLLIVLVSLPVIVLIVVIQWLSPLITPLFIYMSVYSRQPDLEKLTAEVEGYPTVEKVLSIENEERGFRQWIRRLELDLEGDRKLTLRNIGPIAGNNLKGEYDVIEIAKIGGYDFDTYRYYYKDTDEYMAMYLGWFYGFRVSEIESAMGHSLPSIQSIVEQYDAILAWFEENAEYARPRMQPIWGLRGSTSTTYLKDGSKKQDRRYDVEDGYPAYDIDYDHDHGQGVPHIHLWGRPLNGDEPTKKDRGEGLPLSPYYYRQYD